MPIEDKSCANYGLMARVMLGECYCKPHAFYFGECPVVLTDRKNAQGQPLAFQLTHPFYDENEPGMRFGLTPEDSGEITDHFMNCDAPGCQEARRRHDIVMPAIEGKFPQPIVLRCAFETGASTKNDGWAYGATGQFNIPDNGQRDSADFFEPYFRWFDGEWREDYVWPSETERVCLYSIGGYVNARIDHEAGIVRLVQQCKDGKQRQGTIPLELIRQMRIRLWASPTTNYWWNPDEFHIETKPKIVQEGVMEGQGNISIQFRALPEVESRAKRFLSRGIEFKLDARSRF